MRFMRRNIEAGNTRFAFTIPLVRSLLLPLAINRKRDLRPLRFEAGNAALAV